MSDSPSISSVPYDNRFNLMSLTDKNIVNTKTLERQARNRMAELIGRVDIGGTAGVKFNKDGTYEVLAKSETDDAGRLKTAVENAFSEDKILNSILDELKAQYKVSAEAAQSSGSAEAHTSTQLRMLDENGDTVEISDESRAKLDQIYEKNKHLFEPRGLSDRVIYNYTARNDIVIPNEDLGLQFDADGAFRAFTGGLLDAAQEKGEYENDFLLELDKNNNLFISGAKSKSGGQATDKAESEKSSINSILDSLNQAIKGSGGENESDMLKSLRKFFEASKQHDAEVGSVMGYEKYAQTKFPFLLRTSSNLW